MSDFLNRWVASDRENAKLLAEETLIAEVTDALWGSLRAAGITKSELAQRMDASKGHVSQLLSGSRNMTLRTLADVCFALDVRPSFKIAKAASDWHTVTESPLDEQIMRPRLRLITENGEYVPTNAWAAAA